MNYVDARGFEVANRRLLSRALGIDPRFIVLVVYGIKESTTTYNETIIAERRIVDDSFYSITKQLCAVGFDGWSIDSSGSVCEYSKGIQESTSGSFPIHEFLEYLPESRGIFKTLELGCCSTYSHHTLGTRCLCCILLCNSLDQIPKSVVNYSM